MLSPANSIPAIAIITVVGSHAGWPGFSGGFIGVDGFFVISGYLIINQIVTGIDNRSFRFFDFFARRGFRILPAFLLVMVVTLFLATVIFVQPQYKEFAESFFLSTIMVGNHHYLAHQGYFEMAAFTKPLLHMWSLAVEEQFYVVFPLVVALLIGRRRGADGSPRWSLRARLGVFAALVVVVSSVEPALFHFGIDRTYYGTDTRAAEIALGILLAVLLFPSVAGARADRPIPRAPRRALAVASTAALVLSSESGHRWA